MKKQLVFLLFLSTLCITYSTYGQSYKKIETSNTPTKLFRSDTILPIKLIFSNKNVKRNTNDSTYIKTDLSYLQADNTWKTFEVRIRARGNFRRANCYFPPLKVKTKKAEYKNTLFDKNKTLKFVLPCLKEKDKNDNIVKEYMAYKLNEIISPYHFKTRLIEIEFSEIKRKDTIQHQLKGIIIEDDKKVAKRIDGKVYKRNIHPLNQDATASVRNAFFQFMIANTDFSTTYSHNGKLIFVNKKMVPIPYDFDMSGLVNASYSVVSNIQNETLEITSVTERMYRGFKRDAAILQQVRREFITNKSEIFELIDSLEPYFENPRKFETAKKFILDFYTIMANDKLFKSKIVDMARSF